MVFFQFKTELVLTLAQQKLDESVLVYYQVLALLLGVDNLT